MIRASRTSGIRNFGSLSERHLWSALIKVQLQCCASIRKTSEGEEVGECVR